MTASRGPKNLRGLLLSGSAFWKGLHLSPGPSKPQHIRRQCQGARGDIPFEILVPHTQRRVLGLRGAAGQFLASKTGRLLWSSFAGVLAQCLPLMQAANNMGYVPLKNST
eukprot:scaffold279809_cov32-Prasinocladus_malaysianus.AAC.2